MALQITNPNERLHVDAIRVLLYGHPGIGKSSTAYTCKRPLLLDFDNGAHRSEYSTLGTTVRIDSWADIEEMMRDTEFLSRFDTICLDTVGKCLDYMTAHIIKQNPKMGTAKGTPTMQGWGELSAMFGAWMRDLTMLKKDIVMLSHFRDEKEGDNIRKRPKAQGQSYAIILEAADFAGFVYMENERRTIGFAPTDDYFGKDSARLGKVLIPDFASDPTFGASLIDSMKTAFGANAEAQQSALDAIKKWEVAIDEWTEPEHFTQGLVALNKQIDNGTLRAAVGKQLKAYMNNHGKGVGVEYDTKAKTFVAMQAEAVA